jgi:hypothetical protein
MAGISTIPDKAALIDSFVAIEDTGGLGGKAPLSEIKTLFNAGTVTSVALTAPAIFTVGGSPITTSGTLAIALANQNANLVWAGPGTAPAAAPTFRALVAADIPNLDAAKITSGTFADALISESSVTQHVAAIFAAGTTDDLPEGSTNLYWTDERFDTAFGNKTTDDLPEGATNLYWTDDKFDTAFGNKTTDDLLEGSTNLYYASVLFDADFATKSSDDLANNSDVTGTSVSDALNDLLARIEALENP